MNWKDLTNAQKNKLIAVSLLEYDAEAHKFPHVVESWDRCMSMIVKGAIYRSFSNRYSFLACIQHFEMQHQEHNEADKYLIAWPDCFFYITPDTICKAALLATNIIDEQGNVLSALNLEEE